MKDQNRKIVIDFLKVQREILKKSQKKKIKKEVEITPEEAIKKITEEKEKERQVLDGLKKKINTFYTNLSEVIPTGFCSDLEPHCLNLGIIEKGDIVVLHQNATSGQCDFYNKCKNRRKECGENLELWSLKLSTPDKDKVVSYKYPKTEDGEE